MCSKCETVDHLNIDYEHCGKRVHMYWEDSIGKFIEYLRLFRPFADKIYVISHTSCGYDALFLLRRFLELRWVPKLITDGMKILSICVDNLDFLDSLNFLAMSLKSMLKSFYLTFKKGHYPHFFNTTKNSDYVGMLFRTQVLWSKLYVWWWASLIFGVVQEAKDNIFRNKKELLAYCVDDVSVLRQACCAFRNLFFEIGQDGPLSASYTLSSNCNKMLRNIFLKLDTVGINRIACYRIWGGPSMAGVHWSEEKQYYSCR
jgi:hypothetical protein